MQRSHSSLSNDTNYLVTKEDCLQSIKLLHAFYRSDERADWQVVNEDGESSRLGRSNDIISKLYRPTLEK